MDRTNPCLTALSGARLAVAGADAFASARTGDRLERSLLEILAGRHVVQLALTLAKPTRRVVAAGATVDALHSLSMVGLAAASPSHRRGALTEAAVAGGMAAAGALISVAWESVTWRQPRRGEYGPLCGYRHDGGRRASGSAYRR